MQRKTKMLIFSFGLSVALVLGTLGFTGMSEANENSGMMNMMKGHGMSKMMDRCNEFMSSHKEDNL
ncbi:hypothetical protein [Bacillus solitudinis]|uniref:hypothetical protein n=1 Tax=Bacillus solitudinis TaxID=2014074 RepID=UPI000C24B083|nr:hypothetical protein [Bacillus solitudinis]